VLFNYLSLVWKRFQNHHNLSPRRKSWYFSHLNCCCDYKTCLNLVTMDKRYFQFFHISTRVKHLLIHVLFIYGQKPNSIDLYSKFITIISKIVILVVKFVVRWRVFLKLRWIYIEKVIDIMEITFLNYFSLWNLVL